MNRRATSNPRPTPHAFGESLGVGLLVLGGYLLLRISPLLTLGALSDDGIYLALGKALADGDGFRSMYAAGDAVHGKYPPGLPLVHALLWTLSDSLTRVHRWALLMSAVVTATAGALLWWVGRRRLGLGWLGLAVFVIGPLFLESSVQYLNLAISEPWFLLCWAGALALFPVALERGWGGAVGLGLCVGVAVLFRSQAIVSVPAFILAFWWGKRAIGASETPTRGRTVAMALAAFAPWLLWSLRKRALMAVGPVPTQPDELGYASWFPTGGPVERAGYFLDVARYNLEAYGTFLPDQLFRPASLGLIVLVGLVGAAGAGAFRSFRRAPDLVLSLAAQLTLVLIWPFAQDRFAVPLFPFLGLLALLAFPNPSRGARRVGTLLCVAALAVVGSRQAGIRAGTFQPGNDDVLYHPSRFLVANSFSLLTAGQWLERNARPDDVVLAPFAPSLFLYTGQKTINAEPAQPDLGPNVFDEPGRFLARRVEEDGATLLILMGLGFDIVRDVAEVQRQCPSVLEYLETVERPAQLNVYRIHPDACLRSMAAL